jgi:hypothetical protein
METNITAIGSEARSREARPPFEPVDLDRSNRPGVPKERPPQPWPNSRFPPERMHAAPAAPKHGRPNKPMPPVYGTAVPPRGLSGSIRKLAYRYPDHYVRHWQLLLLGDRVDSWETRAKRYLPVVLPVAALGYVAMRVLEPRR